MSSMNQLNSLSHIKTTSQILKDQQKERALIRGLKQKERDEMILQCLLNGDTVGQICQDMNIGMSTIFHAKKRLRAQGLW